MAPRDPAGSEESSDFRVVDLPLQGAERPSLHVLGSAVTTRRTVAILGPAMGAATPMTLREIPVTEMNAGVAMTVPMSVVSPGAGAQSYIGYQGALVLAGGACPGSMWKVMRPFQ